MKDRLIRTSIIVGMVVLFIGASFASTVMSKELKNNNILSSIYTVDDEGDGDYTSIQDAIDAASDGDKIKVYSGTYNEHITIGKELEVLGLSEELGSGSDTVKPVIDGGGIGDVVAILTNETTPHENVEISGFCIQNSGSSNAGITVYHTSVFVISDNDIKNNRAGIFIDRSDRAQVIRNNISDNVWGIVLESADHNIVNENIVEDNSQYGMKFDKSPYNTVSLNEIKKHGEGSIGICFVAGAKGNTIQQNDFLNNDKHGFFVNTFNTWSDNYWDDITLPIYVIWGELHSTMFQWLKIPIFQFDWRPSSIPNTT